MNRDGVVSDEFLTEVGHKIAQADEVITIVKIDGKMHFMAAATLEFLMEADTSDVFEQAILRGVTKRLLDTLGVDEKCTCKKCTANRAKAHNH